MPSEPGPTLHQQLDFAVMWQERLPWLLEIPACPVFVVSLSRLEDRLYLAPFIGTAGVGFGGVKAMLSLVMVG